MHNFLDDFISIKDTLIVEGYNSNADIEKYYNIINGLLALEIINDKCVDIIGIRLNDTVEEYNEIYRGGRHCPLIKEEFEFLKEILKERPR